MDYGIEPPGSRAGGYPSTRVSSRYGAAPLTRQSYGGQSSVTGRTNSHTVLTDQMTVRFEDALQVADSDELDPYERAAFQSIARLSDLNATIEEMLVNFEGKIHVIERKRVSLEKSFKVDIPVLQRTPEGQEYIKLMEGFLAKIDDGIRIVKAAEHAKPYLIAGEPAIGRIEAMVDTGNKTEALRIWDTTKKARKDNSAHGVYNTLRDFKYRGVPNVEAFKARYEAMQDYLYPAQKVNLTHTRDKVFDKEWMAACNLAQRGKRMVAKARDHCRNGQVDLAEEAWRQGRRACIQLQTEPQFHEIIEVKTALTMYERLRKEIEDRIAHLKTRKPKPVEALVKQHARATERLQKEAEAKAERKSQQLAEHSKKNMERKSGKDTVLGRAIEAREVKKKQQMKKAALTVLATQGTRLSKIRQEAAAKKRMELEEKDRKKREAKEAARKAEEDARLAAEAIKNAGSPQMSKASSVSSVDGSSPAHVRPSTTDRTIAAVADTEVELLLRRVTDGRSMEDGTLPTPPPQAKRKGKGKGKKKGLTDSVGRRESTDSVASSNTGSKVPVPNYAAILEERASPVDVNEDTTPVYQAPRPSGKVLQKHPGAEIPVRPVIRRAKHASPWNSMTQEHSGY